MQKTIKVNIGGKEYSLRGENEEITALAAEEVNKQLKDLQSKLNEPIPTLSLLTALNIAEKYYTNKKQMEVDTKYLAEQLSEMVKFLNNPAEQQGSLSSD